MIIKQKICFHTLCILKWNFFYFTVYGRVKDEKIVKQAVTAILNGKVNKFRFRQKWNKK